MHRSTVARLTGLGCAVPIVLLAVAGWERRWTSDDAFIYFRVVANLQDGLGPVWNAGERVEAYTSPAWLALLWLCSSVLSFAAVEWVAILLGLALTVLGLALAARGALVLRRHAGAEGPALPLGLAVVAALPASWDFATSGLETGLVLAWLGACFWALASLGAGRRRRPAAVAVLIGLGPLVRPDLALFSAGFLVALLLGPGARDRRHALVLVAAAAILPLAYQVFRMGYFAALVPNTALAKEAGAAEWARGWRYLENFVAPYDLYVPALLVALLGALELRAVPAARWRLALVAAPPICAVAYALYVVRFGGDFMHGRLLLPSLFAALLPVAVVVPRRGYAYAAAGTALVAWAVVCAATLRPPGDDRGIADERIQYARVAREANPVTLDDYRPWVWAGWGRELRALAERGRHLVVDMAASETPRLGARHELARSAPYRVVAPALGVGTLGYAAGPDVYVVDQLGLGDPVAARTRLEELRLPTGLVIPRRPRAGHDKYLPKEWAVARFGAPGARAPGGLAPAWVASARRALACPDLRRLLLAVRGRMTAGRFLDNVGDSPSLTRLRFSPNPVAAERELCT